MLLNATVVAPTAAGFLSIRPGDATGAPSTSSLNFVAGDIVPNSVQVGLPASGANAGQIDITFDAFGQAGPTTEVLIDVVGYMIAGGAGTGPTDPALLARLTALEVSRPFAVAATGTIGVVLTTTPASVLDVQVIAPVAGNVTINYSTFVTNAGLGQRVICAPFRSTEIPPTSIFADTPSVGYFRTADVLNGDDGSVSGTAQFAIGAGDTITYSLACKKAGAATASVLGRAITAIFTPAP